MPIVSAILNILVKMISPILEIRNIFSFKELKRKLNDSIFKLGPRYTSELHVNLQVEDNFIMLAKDGNGFLEKMYPYFNLFSEASSKIKDIGDEQYDNLVKKFLLCVEHVKEFYFNCEKNKRKRITLDSVIKEIESTKSLLGDIYNYGETLKRQNSSKKIADQIHYNERRVFDVEDQLQKLYAFFKEGPGRFLNAQIMLLVGKAGSGKSHLLADIAKKRLQSKKWTCLFLGNTFEKKDFWKQFLEKLSVKWSKGLFLSLLDKYGWFRGSRSLIFIDALNECDVPNFWEQNLESFFYDIQQYRNIGVVLSIRSEYVDYILPKQIKSKVDFVEHKGFEGAEFEAIKRYFKCYEINLPNTPLLNPEFSNPLFLKLFCEMLKNKRLHEMPSGFDNLLEVFKNYIEDLNERISKKYAVLPSLNLIRKSVESLALEMQRQDKELLPSDDTLKILNVVLFSSGINAVNLYKDLVSEGILVESFDEEKNASVYFAYEKYYDLIVAKALVEAEKNDDDIKLMFEKNGSLYKYVVSEYGFSRYQGLLNAWAVFLPDVYDIELFDVVPDNTLSSIKEAFLDGLLWRKKINIDSIKNYTNKEILADDYYKFKWFDVCLLLCAKSECSLNSDFLHEKLFPLSIGIRDAEWSIFISTQNDSDRNNVKRIIDWAWYNDDFELLSDESTRLLGQMLIWFLTSMNREVRDKASTALVNLLKNKIDVLICLLDKFKDVNDPYVLQRMYAVAFGCVTNSFNRESIKNLCECVYKNIFESVNVVPDILLRDYAMNTIEYGKYLGIKFDFDISKIYPPYRSVMPKSFPSNNVVDANLIPYGEKDVGSPEYAINMIMHSMTTEYGRGTSHYGDFGRYVWDSAFDDWDVDTNLLSNYAIMWILKDSGYDYNIHGEFDMSVSHGERFGNICERIGKKYQWIAFYDLLARVSDNCQMKKGSYKGSFEPFVRDFDPTTIKKSIYSADESFYSSIMKKFHWNQKNRKWITKKNNFPSIGKFLVEKDADNVEWMILNKSMHLKQPDRLDGMFKPKKDFFCSVNSYIMTDNDFNSFKSWAKRQNFYGRSLPESHQCYKAYSREYCWSKAYKAEYGNDYDWDTISDLKENGFAVVALTNYCYYWENEYDHSKRSLFSFIRPSKELCKLMGLHQGIKDGEFVDESGLVVCKNPSVNEKHPSCLMVRKKEFLNALKNNGLKIAWTILGEKRIASLNDEDRYTWMTLSGVGFMKFGRPYVKMNHFMNRVKE